MSAYLKRKRDRLVFRRRIPQKLLERFGRAELTVQLGDVGPRTAKVLARQLAARSDRLFDMIEKHPALTREKIAELARQFFDGIVAGHERRAAALVLDDPDEFTREARRADRAVEGAQELLRLNDTSAAAEAAGGLLSAAGIDLPPEAPEFKELCRALLRANLEAQRLREARIGGDYSIVPVDPLFKPAPATAPAVERKPPAPVAPLFSVASAAYIAEKVKAGEWRGSTEHQYRRFYDLFLGFLCDKPVNAYSRADVGRWVEALQKIPATYGQSSALRGKTLKELVAYAAANPTVEAVTARTVQKHTIALSGLFGWLRDRGHVEDNPVTRSFRYKKDKRAREQRAAWEVPQLNKLFASPIWSGCKNEARRATPGTLVLRDALFWVPLIAVFSGMRLEEIAALRVEDLRNEGGVSFFDITPAGGKLLKTAAAVRRVPVHKELIAAGLPQYVEQQRRAKVERLFPELKPGGPDKRLGFYVSKKLARYFDAIGIPELDVHGMRHAAITGLQRAEVPEPIIRDLVGHEGSGSETSRYSKGYPLPQLADAINKLAYPSLDLRHLK